MLDALTVEQPAHQHPRLVEPADALAGRGAERYPERLVLAFEPGGADAEDRATTRHMVERRRELGRHARVAERIGADHQSEAYVLGDRAEGGQCAPALEDRLLPWPEDGEQVVPGPHRIPAVRFRRE